MPAVTVQAPNESESLIMFVYPSIAGDAPGRLIGRALHALPLPFVNHTPLALSLLGILLLPVTILIFTLGALAALGGYVVMKVFGHRYVLTTQAIQVWSSIGQRLVGAVSLDQIADVSVNERKGQAFFHAADLVILDRGGNEVLTLEGVPRADVFRQTILKARDARVQVAEALRNISARSGR